MAPSPPPDLLGPLSHLAGAANAYLQVQRRLTADDQKLDLELKLGQLKQGFGKDQAALEARQMDPSTAVHPDVYPELVMNALGQRMTQTMGALKYPETAKQFQIHAMPFVTEQAAKARREALKVKGNQAEAAMDILNAEDINAAVYGATPQERQAAYARAVDRTQGLAWVLGDKLNTKLAHLLVQTEKGTAEVEFQNPATRQQALNELLSAQSKRFGHVDPTERFALARTLMDRLETERRRDEAVTKQVAEDMKQDALRDLSIEADRGTLTTERLELVAGQLRFHETELERIKAIMRRDPAEKEKASDTATLDRVLTATRRMHPTMTAAQLNALHDQFRTTGVGLNTKDWREALDHVTSARKYEVGEGKSDARYNHAQAEQELDRLLGIPLFYEKLDPVKEKARAIGYQALRRRSNAFAGTENPLAVLEEMGPRLVGMLGAEARVNGDKLRGLIRTYGFDPANPASVEQARPRLNPGQYQNLRKLYMELSEVQAEEARVEAARPKTPTPRGKRKEGSTD
jgi:hypothetical protein